MASLSMYIRISNKKYALCNEMTFLYEMIWQKLQREIKTWTHITSVLVADDSSWKPFGKLLWNIWYNIILRVSKIGHAMFVTDYEWSIIKTTYNIINMYWEQNIRNMQTLYDVFSIISIVLLLMIHYIFSYNVSA